MFWVLKFHPKQHQHEISRLIFIVFFQIIFLEIIKPSRLFVSTVACKIVKPSQLFVDFCTFFSKFLVPPPPKIEPLCKTSPLFVVRFYCTVKVYDFDFLIPGVETWTAFEEHLENLSLNRHIVWLSSLSLVPEGRGTWFLFFLGSWSLLCVLWDRVSQRYILFAETLTKNLGGIFTHTQQSRYFVCTQKMGRTHNQSVFLWINEIMVKKGSRLCQGHNIDSLGDIYYDLILDLMKIE